MATKAEKSALEKIDTEEILRKLKEAKDEEEFFYLYLLTADKERKKKQSPTQQASALLSHTLHVQKMIMMKTVMMQKAKMMNKWK